MTSERGIIILLGATGSGKSVQGGRLLHSHRDWQHISSGDLLRSDPSVAASLANGQLVDSAEVERVLSEALTKADAAAMIVLDGFPRTLDQAAWLEQASVRYRRKIAAVIEIDVWEKTVWERLSERARSDDSKAAITMKLSEYHAKTQPLREYYDSRCWYVKVDGNGTIDEVAERIEEALHAQSN